MIPTPELINRVQELRRKVHDGTITLDEQKEAIILLRAGRISAAQAASASKSTKAKKAPKQSAEDMLAELDGM